MDNKKKSGGQRPNAGRKQKYGEPTVHIGFRVPQSKVEEVTDWVNDKLNEYLFAAKHKVK